MKHALRILLNILTALSLLIFLATIFLSIRNYYAGNIVWGDNMTKQTVWAFGRSQVSAVRFWMPPDRPSANQPRTSRLTPTLEQLKGWNLPGISCTERWVALEPTQPSRFDYRFTRTITIDYWLLATVSAILPLVWIIRAWRRRRNRFGPGMCENCGYDLRASAGRCPECGMGG